MKDVKWLVSRLKSMNVPEVMWRVQQKMLQRKEYKTFFTVHKPVTDIKEPKELEIFKADGTRLGINWDNREWQLFESLDLFGIFDYQKYKTNWNAGFQTDNKWPSDDFSYNIPISQREDIGDIRTNWELNRHFQFVGLAKNYYVTGEQKYLNELFTLFEDWNNKNYFLHGVQWTSAMEVAIRIVSWSYMYTFVEKAGGPREYLDKVANGIKIMASYILMHRARYSSANNHLIVEMLGIGVAGVLFACDKWVDYSVKVLTEELPRQNYPDGVNKEMSLHYQTFVMESYGVMAVLLRRNGRSIPNIWFEYLENMSKFVADCCGDYGEVVVFGDNDEGKILDFSGCLGNHYQYVLQLMSIVLSKKYTDSDIVENINWIATNDELDEYRNKVCYQPGLVSHYKQGGYTILRSKNRKILIGVDHAELGFGSIAAHGHCDALSIQLFYEGKPVLVDSGTYNYHAPKDIRNRIRSTKAHNTIYVDGVEQAEMRGPFLFDRRYSIKSNEIIYDGHIAIIDSTISYNGITHNRKVKYDFVDKLYISDYVYGIKSGFFQMWNFSSDNIAFMKNMFNELIKNNDKNIIISWEDNIYSKSYNNITTGKLLKLFSKGEKIELCLSLKLFEG